MNTLISIIIPFYNERENIGRLVVGLENVCDSIKDRYQSELVFVDDGSTDGGAEVLSGYMGQYDNIRLIEFSRNFGKEAAISAGLAESKGKAAIIIDADLQHPPRLIPEFIQKWENGAEVVVGVKKNRQDSIYKRICSSLFYKIINMMVESKVTPHATDFRLIDRIVIDEFNRLSERNRMARGLIDWLGFKREYVYFEAQARYRGTPTYSFLKLVHLAFSTMVSLSLLPLKLAGYLGMIITLFSGGLGLFILIGKYILHNSFALGFSGTAQLAILILFLIGITLSCLGLIALYIANIHTEVIGRPMYVIRRRKN